MTGPCDCHELRQLLAAALPYVTSQAGMVHKNANASQLETKIKKILDEKKQEQRLLEHLTERKTT
jgi:hypothetical protein